MPDDYLATLVEWATGPEHDGETSITLNTSGLVITGRIVSERLYIAETARYLAHISGEDPESALDGLNVWFGRTDEVSDEAAPRYIHLAEAKIVGGLGSAIEVGRWRGRLEAIVGFTLGGVDV